MRGRPGAQAGGLHCSSFGRFCGRALFLYRSWHHCAYSADPRPFSLKEAHFERFHRSSAASTPMLSFAPEKRPKQPASHGAFPSSHVANAPLSAAGSCSFSSVAPTKHLYFMTLRRERRGREYRMNHLHTKKIVRVLPDCCKNASEAKNEHLCANDSRKTRTETGK